MDLSFWYTVVGFWIAVIGTLLALVGLVILIFKPKNESILSYQYNTTSVLDISEELSKDLVIHYKDNKVKMLKRTFIVFWNKGKKSILYENGVNKNSPIKIHFNNKKKEKVDSPDSPISKSILSAYIYDTNDKNNDISVKISPKSNNEAFINFYCINFNDGAVIEILHTSESDIPKIEGSIIGKTKTIKNFGEFYISRNSKSKKMAFQLIVFILVIMSLVAIIIALTYKPEHLRFAIALACTTPPYLAILAGLTFKRFTKFPTNLIRKLQQ